MAYEKQNFKNGEILPADKLNHIEDGIVDLENSQAKIDDLNITTDKAWSSRRIIDALCPPLEETGNPVVCYPVPGYPLGVTVDFAPIQEGEGDPSPENIRPIKPRETVDVTRCGVNLCPYGTQTFVGYYGKSFGYFLPSGTYTFSVTAKSDDQNYENCLIYFFDTKNNKSVQSGTIKRNIRTSITVSVPGKFDAIYLYSSIGAVQSSGKSATYSDVQLEVGSAPSAFAPYTGQTATLTLPRTIYGGKLDAVTGEGQETWHTIVLTGQESSHIFEKFFCLNIGNNPKPKDITSGRSSHYKYATYGKGYIGVTNDGVSAVLGAEGKFTIDEAGLSAWKSYLAAQYAAGTPVQITYKLEKPTPITATGGKPIPALSGVNAVLTDADSVTVTGRAMPEKNRNQNLSTDILFKYPRTGKVYTVKIPKFTSNPTTVCEKLDDNIGLVCEASTDTIEGRDDYAEIPLFKWYNCNYKRDENGHAYPIAIEGFDDNYTTSGNIDVGVIQMTPFVKWDDSNDDYIILSITDNPTEGYRAWSTARVGGEVYPYVIHSKYISSLGTDGLLHSVPNAKPERNQSYNNMITNYAKKGSGYKGAGVERNTWQIIFTLIKYANKSSQNIFTGTTGYSFQYSASIQSAEKHTYFPVTNAQAANIIIGGYVSVGYAYKTSDTATSLDRGYDTVHSYADSVKVLKIEDLDDSNKAVYLDVKEGFDTIQHEYSDTLSAPITLTSIHWYSGSTDSVMGHHDGSFVNNNSKYPYRVQGVEYAVGGYTVASDTVIVFTDNNEKDVYVSPSNIAHSSADATIKSNYKNVGHIPSGEWWIGDIGFDTDTNATWPTVRGSGSATGVGDYNYGSTGNNGAIREYLQGGHLGDGSVAGSSCLSC